MPQNGDLKRWYADIPETKEARDFVRLGSDGKIPSEVLPGYVDDVIDGYYNNNKFYKTRTGSGTAEDPYVYTDEIQGEKGKLYIDLANGDVYRWINAQTGFVPIAESAATLASKMEGGVGVVVDLNQAGTKVQSHLDMTGSYPQHVLVTTEDPDTHQVNGVEWQSYIPKPVGSDLGKYLKYSTTGMMWVDLPTPTTIHSSSLTLTETSTGSKIFKSEETFESHVHLMFEVESSGIHSGADFDLHPYNSSVCLVVFRLAVSGTVYDCYAQIGSDNKIQIDCSAIPAGTYEIVAHYFIYS